MFKLNRMDKLIQTQVDVTKREVPVPDLSTEKIFSLRLFLMHQ